MSEQNDKMMLLSKEDLQIIVNNEVREYKKFAFRSNMIQMAVAFMLGAAFQKLVTSLSDNVIMPIINYGIGITGVPWRELVIKPTTGLSIEMGKFIGSFVDFFILSLILYLVYVKIFKGKDTDGHAGTKDQRTKDD